jgi:hypothetical protein
MTVTFLIQIKVGHNNIYSEKQVDLKVTVQTCIQEVPGSNLSQNTGCTDFKFSWVFTVPTGKCLIISRLIPSKSFLIYLSTYLPMLYPLDTQNVVKQPADESALCHALESSNKTKQDTSLRMRS